MNSAWHHTLTICLTDGSIVIRLAVVRENKIKIYSAQFLEYENDPINIRSVV